MTASCTVNRLYPEIASVGLFSITWGDSTNSHYEKHNPVGTDKAFKYTVTMTKILKSSDNGTTIQCDLHPEIGTAVYQKETVIVNCKSYNTVFFFCMYYKSLWLLCLRKSSRAVKFFTDPDVMFH